MSIKKNRLYEHTEYTVSYDGMMGVDFSSANKTSKSRRRFAHLENMYRDYRGGGDGITESIPGFRKLTSVYKHVHSIFTHKNASGEEEVVFHAGTNLYRFALSKRDELSMLSPIFTLKDSKSRAFISGSDLYVMDGNGIVRVRSDGSCSQVGDSFDAKPYIPTTYYNGKEHEQRNLLTDKFKEKYVIAVSCDIAAASEGLKYKILSTENMSAAVCGIGDDIGGAVYIPSHVDIGGKRYAVTEISEEAFKANTKITSLTLSESVKRICNSAFISCHALSEVVLRGVEFIEANAFLGCLSLSKVYIGAPLVKMGVAAFAACPELKEIDYEGTTETFRDADIQADVSAITVNYGSKYTSVTVEIPIFSPAISLESVKLDGIETSYTQKNYDGLIASIIITENDASMLDGKEVVLLGTMHESKFTKNSAGVNFLSESGSSISGRDAILGCTVCENFDGRVFLSGNKNLPNTVFYSSRDETGRNNPLYFGILNYFNDGCGSFPVKSLLAAGESLAVFKEGDDGGGSIYYHTPKSTEIGILPKIYPVSYIHSGICAVGESASFFDDPVFLSPIGCTALDKRAINLERSVCVRSSNVNPKLLTENMSEISIAEWCGYLVLQAEDRIYLADSRQVFTNAEGEKEYEWYYLCGIGAYRGAQKVFRYSELAKNGYAVNTEKIDTVAGGEVYIAMADDSEAVYYVEEDGVKYEVYTDGEMKGGIFSPASCVCSAGDNLLLFGTSGGDICIFNNDKRGVAPPHIRECAGFNAEEYGSYYGSRIHPYYYNFDSHAPRYALCTVSDDCSIPHFTKNTVKNSLAVKMRCLGGESVICEAGTERSGYKEIARLPDSALNFSELDFSSISFSNTDFVTLALRERERGWIEKSISLYSDEYSSPFGVCSITYRFSKKGKIKY